MFAKYASLDECPVFVTGGGTGIGAAIVEAFVEQGAKVSFLDIQRDPSEELVEKLSDGRYKPLFIQGDLTDIAVLRMALDRAQSEIGPIGVLVNNAGRDDRHVFDDVTPEYWDDVVASNLRHQFFSAQAVRPQMKQRGVGSIINFSSIAWMAGASNVIAYSACKAGVVGLTRSLAVELGSDNIRVNAIAPGAVITERQLRLWYSEEQADKFKDRQLIQKRLLPDEIARSVLFLASEDSRMITKQCLIVDGGLL